MIVTKRESMASLIHDTSPTLRHSLQQSHNKGLYYGFRDAILTRLVTIQDIPDTGNYTCELTVTAQQTHVTVQAPEQSAVEDITVQGNVYDHSLTILYYVLCISLPPHRPPSS